MLKKMGMVDGLPDFHDNNVGTDLGRFNKQTVTLKTDSSPVATR